MNKFVDLLIDLYSNSITNLNDTVIGYISFNLAKTPTDGVMSLWDFAEKACNSIFMPIATGLLIFFFLFELCNQSTNENFNLQQFYKLMAKFVLTMFLIQNGFTIFTNLVNLGYGLLNKATATFSISASTTTQATEVFRQALTGQGLFATLGAAILVILIAVAGQIIKLIASIICITRLFTIILMAAGMPLGVVDIYHGMSSNGMRFFKSFAAVCIQGVVMLLVLQISNIMSYVFMPELGTTTGLAAVLGFMASSLLVQLTTVTLLQKSLQITKEFLGV